MTALLLCLLLSPIHAAPASYDGFDKLPDKKKESIVRRLFDKGTLGKPEHKPILKDILATQARYAYANAALFTCRAMDSAGKEMAPLVERIYQRPKSLTLYEKAFLWLRGPLDPGLFAAADTLIRSGLYQTEVTEEQAAAAKKRLLEDADKEAVLVCAFKVALSGSGKGGTDRGRRAGVEILRSLDPVEVRKRVSRFKRDFERSGGREIEQLSRQLGL
ncbi:MAG: hypothetical protein WC728_14270 [Elusimicrobiota bacterium]